MQTTNVNNLVINKLTTAQFNNITPSANELYFITDDTGLKAGTGISINQGTATIGHSNSVSAKTSYGSTATTASANGGTIKVTDIQYDAQGHITASTDRTITLSTPTSFTITANATDGLWDLTGTNGTNAVTYAVAPYTSQQSKASFDTGTVAPTRSDRLNYNGYLYATKLYSGGKEVLTGLAWNQITQSGAQSIAEGSSDVTDNTEIFTSYASNNGFADTNDGGPGKVYRRDAIKLYNYIKTKAGTSGSGFNIAGNAATATKADKISITTASPSSATAYYPTFSTSVSGDNYIYASGHGYWLYDTGGAGGIWLCVGNAVQGYEYLGGLNLYDSNRHYGSISCDLTNGLTDNRSYILPDKSGTFAMTNDLTWANITDKPSAFTPSSHTHSNSEVGLGNVTNHQQVHEVTWDSTNKKITRSKNGTAGDVVQFVAGSNVTLTAESGKLTIASSYTNTDTKVTQGTTTNTSWRKVLLNGGSDNVYSAWNSAVVEKTDVIYQSKEIAVQPSSGSLAVNKIYTKGSYPNIIGNGTGVYFSIDGDWAGSKGNVCIEANTMRPSSASSTAGMNLGASGNRWSKLYVGSADSYGGTEQPIYWNAGVPAPTSYALKATVNNATQWGVAYYSTARNLTSTAAGTAGYILIGAGSAAPAWYDGTVLTGAAAASWKTTFNGTTDSSYSKDTAAAVVVKGGVSVEKKISAKEVRIDNNQSVKGVSLQYDASLEVLNFVFS